MTSKYAGLPDIDTQQPDVYETADVPSAYSRSLESDSDSDDGNAGNPSTSALNSKRASANQDASRKIDGALDESRLDAGQARNKFIQSNANVNAASADFSSSLVHSRKHRLPNYMLPETSSYAINGHTSQRGLSSTATRQLRTLAALSNDGGQVVIPETPTERLRRLRYEMEELQTQMEQDETMDDNVQQGEEDAKPELSRRDDADKTRPVGRPKKRKTLDKDGELLPSIVLSELQRLKRNLVQLSEHVDTDGTSNTPGIATDMQARSNALVQQLTTLQITADSHNASEESQSVELATANGSALTPTRLDERLQLLESYIGATRTESDESHPLPPPLLSTLSKMEHQLQLLTQPRHLDTISRRVRMLVTDLERVHEARRKIGDNRPLNVALSSGITISTGPAPIVPAPAANNVEQHLSPDSLQKIDSLFVLVPRIDPLLPMAPHLLTRLQSLSTLHSESATFSTNLQDAEDGLGQLKQSEEMLQDLLNGLEESLKSNQNIVTKNIEVLQSRMEQLLERVAKLD